MTDEQINRAIAESEGWKHNGVSWVDPSGLVYSKDPLPSMSWNDWPIPLYTTSLDAMASVVAKMDDKDYHRFIHYLNYPNIVKKTVSMSVREVIEATARQRAIAYLKTKGLYNEK